MNSDYEELRSVLSGYGLIKDNEQINTALIDRVAKIVSKEYRLTKRLAEDEGPISLGTFTSAPPLAQSVKESPKESPKEVANRVDAIAEAKRAAIAAFNQQDKLEAEDTSPEHEEGEAPPPVAQPRTARPMSPQQSHFAGILNKTIPKNLPPTIGAASGGVPEGEDGDIVEVDDDNSVDMRHLFTGGATSRPTLSQLEHRTAGKNSSISRRDS